MELYAFVTDLSVTGAETGTEDKIAQALFARERERLTEPQAINDVWSMDLTHDKLEDGLTSRLFNSLNYIDQESLAIHIDF